MLRDHVYHPDFKGSFSIKAVLNPLVPEPAEIEDVRIETEYAVFPGEPWVRITTTIRNQGIRPAPGYPACPDHTEKATIFRLLDATATPKPGPGAAPPPGS